MEKKTLKDLIEKEELVVIPGIYDCISARAVELAGYQAAFLSSTGVSYSWCGMPDLGLVSADEMLWFASRITEYVGLPLIVSAENGYGDSASAVYRTVKRLVKAGAGAVVLDDTDSRRGKDREGCVGLVGEDLWRKKIAAAKRAVEGTQCLVIARSMAKPVLGLEAALRRCEAAVASGAELTAIEGLKNKEDAEMAARIPGKKMWMDWQANGKENGPVLKNLKEYGFFLASVSFTEEASMYGMLDFAKKNLINGNTVYHDQHDFDDLLKPGEDYHKFFAFHKTWLPMEKQFLDVKALSELPNFVKE